LFDETPAVAVRALLAVKKLPDTIWEPACGPGAIVRVLLESGHRVYATNLLDHGCPNSESDVDSLMERAPSIPIGAVVTNPPFKLATEFRDARFNAVPASDHAASTRVRGEQPTPLDSQIRPSRSRPHLLQPFAHDA
jgi:hypothetical protein